MEQTSTYIEPEDPDADVAGEPARTTIINITNYYAGTDGRRADTDLVRGGLDDSVLY